MIPNRATHHGSLKDPMDDSFHHMGAIHNHLIPKQVYMMIQLILVMVFISFNFLFSMLTTHQTFHYCFISSIFQYNSGSIFTYFFIFNAVHILYNGAIDQIQKKYKNVHQNVLKVISGILLNYFLKYFLFKYFWDSSLLTVLCCFKEEWPSG